MKVRHDAGPEVFEALLAADVTPWGRARLQAFERLREAFPDPDGPPEWGLRQIERGQFDRRLPAGWRPVFLEVYHQWIGFDSEREAARERRLGTWGWWLGTPIPALERLGLGIFASPAAVAALFLGLLLARLGAVGVSHGMLRERIEREEGLRTAAAAASEQAAATQAEQALFMGGTDQLEQLPGLEASLRRLEANTDAALDAQDALRAEVAALLRRTRFPRW